MTVPDKWEYPWFAAWDLAFHCVAARPGRSASSPRTSSGCCSSSSSSIPTARSRPTSGSSPTSTRRSTPGPSGASTTWTASAPGKADRDFLETLLPQAADQLHLVGQQGRSRGQQHLRGRLPRPGQHHRRRPQRTAAPTARARAVRRHRLDGHVLPEHDAHRPGAGQGEPRLRRRWRPSSSSTTSTSPRAMKHMGNRDYQLWDEQDGFFYDVLRYPDGRFQQVPRPLAGRPDPAVRRRAARGRLDRAVQGVPREPRLVPAQPPATWSTTCVHTVERDGDVTHVLTIVEPDQLSRLLSRVCDPDEFLSRLRHPQPVEGARGATRSSSTAVWSATSRPRRPCKIKGGNSNWRGPIWFPTSFLLIESLRKLGKAFGADFAVPTPATADRPITFRDMARGLRRPADPHLHARRARAAGRSSAATRKFQDDPHWRDLISLLRILPRRQRRRPGRLAPDRLDGAGRLADRRVAEVTDGQKRKKAKRNRPAINEFLFPLFVPRAMTAVSCRARRRPYQERGGPPVAQMRPKFRQTWRQRPVKRRLPIVHC